MTRIMGNNLERTQKRRFQERSLIKAKKREIQTELWGGGSGVVGLGAVYIRIYANDIVSQIFMGSNNGNFLPGT